MATTCINEEEEHSAATGGKETIVVVARDEQRAIDATYDTYLQKANDIRRTTRRELLEANRPWVVARRAFLAGAAFLILVGGGIAGTVSKDVGLAMIKWEFPVFVVFLAINTWFKTKLKQRLNEEVIKTGRELPGFAAFWWLYRKGYWREGTLSGRKRDRFLSILGTRVAGNGDRMEEVPHGPTT
jgi:hypothetical protein